MLALVLGFVARPRTIKYGGPLLGFLATTPALAQTATCSDGSPSYSSHFHGTCSHHGGVSVWLNDEMERQANEWCDNNPSLCANSHWVGIGGHGNHPDTAGEERPQQYRGSQVYTPGQPLPAQAPMRYSGSQIYTPGQEPPARTPQRYMGSQVFTPGQPSEQEQSENEEPER